jgi:hypothetical protein
MAGFDFNDKEQLKLLSELSTKYKAEYSVFPTKGQAYYADNLSFPAQDGAVLHSMVRHYKPKKIIEIGSGNSSLAISAAIVLNKKYNQAYSCDGQLLNLIHKIF